MSFSKKFTFLYDSQFFFVKYCKIVKFSCELGSLETFHFILLWGLIIEIEEIRKSLYAAFLVNVGKLKSFKLHIKLMFTCVKRRPPITTTQIQMSTLKL